MNINERFTLIRKHLGLKQYELADLMRTSQAAISRIEKGINPPQSQDLLILKLLFKVNEEWLVTGEGEMFIFKKEATDIDDERRYLLSRLRLLASEINFLIDKELGT